MAKETKRKPKATPEAKKEDDGNMIQPYVQILTWKA